MPNQISRKKKYKNKLAKRTWMKKLLKNRPDLCIWSATKTRANGEEVLTSCPKCGTKTYQSQSVHISHREYQPKPHEYISWYADRKEVYPGHPGNWRYFYNWPTDNLQKYDTAIMY